MKTCAYCGSSPHLIRSKTREFSCKECFINKFEEEIHDFIVQSSLFKPDETIAIGVSGGKDSSVLAYILNKLNTKHQYHVNLVLVAIDEGIKGYRSDSLESVLLMQKILNLPLKILSFEELFGWKMDQIVNVIGRKHNCTYCGVFRRHGLEKGAQIVGASKIATGHNVDDIAETVIMNILRGDLNRLTKCTSPISSDNLSMPRCKPLIMSFEKEIVLYAKYLKINYFATECVYAPFAFRGHARTFIKELESINPQFLTNIVENASKFINKKGIKKLILNKCEGCGSETSQNLCQACVLLDTLGSVPNH